MVERLTRLIDRLFGQVKKEKRTEEQEARLIADWIIVSFTQTEKQEPLRSVYPNQFHATTNINELTESTATILRIEGGVRHQYEGYYWFVVCKMAKSTYIYWLDTNNQSLTRLEANPSGYPLELTKQYSQSNLHKDIPIRFLLNEFFDLYWQNDLAGSEHVDVMFGGSPAKSEEQTTVESTESLILDDLVPST